MKKLLAVAVGILLLNTACKKDSSEIEQQKIYQSYEIAYDENTNKTTISARFSENDASGKKIELSSGSSVTFNGAALSYSGGSYTATMDGKATTATFVYTDLDGKTYSNNLSHANSIANDNIGTMYNNVTYYWYFGGTAVGTGEIIEFYLVNNADSGHSIYLSNSTVGDTYLTIGSDKLSTLPMGYTTAKIKRTKVINTGNFATVGGKITSKYTGMDKTDIQIN